MYAFIYFWFKFAFQNIKLHKPRIIQKEISTKMYT